MTFVKNQNGSGRSSLKCKVNEKGAKNASDVLGVTTGMAKNIVKN